MSKQKLKGYIAVTPEDKRYYYRMQEIQETFKGNVFDKQVRFPKELGVEHPFDFEEAEKVLKKTGIISGIIGKFVDDIVGDFSIRARTENVEALLKEFINNTDFPTVLRAWIREALSKGNGFMEIDLKETKIRVLNANEMFVQRNRKGKVLGYNQFTGKMNNFSVDSRKLNHFEPNQIGHLPVNKIAADAYGIGFIWPNERTIENLVVNEQDLHRLITRKAGSPYHVKVGVPGEHTDTGAVDNVKSLLTFMNTRTEWVTDANTTIDVLNLGDLGKGLIETLNHDVEMLAFGMETPAVLLGKANVPEGLAKVQLEARQRKIQSIREEVESVLEEKIFKPLLLANGLQEEVEFLWNLPGEEEINRRIEKITALLGGTVTTSAAMRAALELELARLFNFEGLEDVLVTPQDAKKEEEENREQENQERENEENIPQPEVPGAKPNAKQALAEKLHEDMTIQEFINLNEFAGFTYTDYVVEILRLLGLDKFDDLRAITSEDIQNGFLPSIEVEKLRSILKDGFKNNSTIREIEGRISTDMDRKDRLKDGKLLLGAGFRANMIARTETVRLANKALLRLYGENKLDRYRFLAALSDRTCPICEGLNGQVFSLTEAGAGTNLPPIHTGCRCSIVGVIE